MIKRDVVAALIFDQERFLICQRPQYKARGLLWEFVGGKVEESETNQQALIRECKEELDVEIKVNELFMDVIHDYPDLTVHLFLYKCEIISGEIKLLEHNDSRWIKVDEIDNYQFCPADTNILVRIKEVHRLDNFLCF